MAKLEARKVYDFSLKKMSCENGDELRNSVAYYTANSLRNEDKSSALKREIIPFCLSHHDIGKRSLDQQAAMLKELGFPGCGHLCQEFGYEGFGYPTNVTVQQRANSLAKHGLALGVAFIRLSLEEKVPIDLEKLAAAMTSL